MGWWNMGTFKCDRCKQEFELGQENELILDGTNDVYFLVLCDKCYEYLSSDYFSPQDIDAML